MEKLVVYSGAAIIGILIAAVVILLAPLAYALGGYITGWVLIVIFPFAGKWVVDGASALGLRVDMSYLPQIGAALGFVGAFFKANQTNKNESK